SYSRRALITGLAATLLAPRRKCRFRTPFRQSDPETNIDGACAGKCALSAGCNRQHNTRSSPVIRHCHGCYQPVSVSRDTSEVRRVPFVAVLSDWSFPHEPPDCLPHCRVWSPEPTISFCAGGESYCFRRCVDERCAWRNQCRVHEEHRHQGGRELCGESDIGAAD